MKKSEIFTELSVKLAQLEAKLDWLIEQQNKKVELENRVKVLEAYVDTQLKQKYYGKILDGYALSAGDFVDSGLQQEWRPSGDLSL